MCISSARSFCIGLTLYLLLAESRPIKLGGIMHGIEGITGDVTGTAFGSSAQDCPLNPTTSVHSLVVTDQDSGTVGGGSGGDSGSSRDGPTVNSGGSANLRGRTEPEHMREEMSETDN